MQACSCREANTEPILIPLTETEALLSQAYCAGAELTVVPMGPLQEIWSTVTRSDLMQIEAVGGRVSSATLHHQDIASLSSRRRDHDALYRLLLIADLERKRHPILSQLQAEIVLWSVAHDHDKPLSIGDLEIIEVIVSVTEDQIAVGPCFQGDLALSVKEVPFTGGRHTEDLLTDAISWAVLILFTNPRKLTTTLDTLCRGDTVLISEATEATPRVAIGAGLGAISIIHAGGVEEAGPERSAALSVWTGLLRIALSGHARLTDTIDAGVEAVAVQLTAWLDAAPRLTGTDTETVDVCYTPLWLNTAPLLTNLSAKAICDVDAGGAAAIEGAEAALRTAVFSLTPSGQTAHPDLQRSRQEFMTDHNKPHPCLQAQLLA